MQRSCLSVEFISPWLEWTKLQTRYIYRKLNKRKNCISCLSFAFIACFRLFSRSMKFSQPLLSLLRTPYFILSMDFFQIFILSSLSRHKRNKYEYFLNIWDVHFFTNTFQKYSPVWLSFVLFLFFCINILV